MLNVLKKIPFTKLTDVPITYAGQTGKIVRVKTTEDGLEFASVTGAGDTISPATNTANSVPQWNGANSKTLKDGLVVGTSANNLLQLDSNAKIPAVDGSQITNLPTIISTSDVLSFLQQELDILELKATASLPIIKKSNTFGDTFSINTGYSNTVQLGTTTAYYDTVKKKYISAIDVSTGYTGTAMFGSPSTKYGMAITTNKACILYGVTRMNGATCTTAQICSNNGGTNVLATVTFSGNVGFLSTPLQLANATTYYIFGYSDGSAYTGWGDTNANGHFPITSTNFNYIGECDTGGTYTSGAWNFCSILTGSNGNVIIDLAIPNNTITGTPVSYELVCDIVDDESGDSVTWKLKNATQSDTAINLNTVHNVVNLTTVATGLEINLNPKTSSPNVYCPSAKTYVLRWNY